MQDTGCVGLVYWDDPEGCYREGGGRGVQDGEHVYTRGGFMLMYAKPVQYCKVKKKEKKRGYQIEITIFLSSRIEKLNNTCFLQVTI